MSIKEVRFENFKSYRNAVLSELSTGVNVIVGRNGHGKSNIFNGISFVFSDMLRKE
jgi:chromosome segregation ATPase